MHFLLVDLSLFDEKARLSEKRRAQLLAAQHHAREDQFETEKRQDRDKPVHQRDADVLQRERRQIRHQHRDHKLGKLQLAELPLAENAHTE